MNLVRNHDTNTVLKTPEISRKYLDIPYGTAHKEELLDIYLPETGDGPFPVLMDIHGGGWFCGVKSSLKFAPVLEGLKRGYAVVSVEFAKSPEWKFPQQVFDIKAAIRFLKANAGKYSLDGDRIGLWGVSSGGHLAAMTAVSEGIPELEDAAGEYLQYSSTVQCAAVLYPVINIQKWQKQIMQYGMDPQEICTNKGSMAGLLLGDAPNNIPDACAFANPETYIRKQCPPFLIQHGLADDNVPFQQSILFADRLEKVIGEEKVILELFPGLGHAVDEFRTPENTNHILDFFDRYLREGEAHEENV
ncbi:MAG: alpha/beta hydrolase [Eubacterium sp.]|nr:alpha/beta hydrolase [Eubacterium sp.]